MYDFCIIFSMFFIYSVLGFIAELFFCSIVEKKIVLNRGFLIGPYCPIYGVAVVIMATTLKRYASDPIIVFSMGALISTFLEYSTSYIMEKIFKTRWWDYSNESFNVNGRVCLKNSILFGIGSLLVIYLTDDLFLKFISYFDYKTFIILNIFLMIIFIVDVIISTFIIIKIRRNSELTKKDMTEEIKEKVKYELSKNLILTKRLLNSFPIVFKNIRGIVNKLDLKKNIVKNKISNK